MSSDEWPAKQPHPATAADIPTPLLLQNSPTPTILLSLQNSSTAPVPGHNQAKEARLYSNTTAKQLEPLAKRAASTCL